MKTVPASLTPHTLAPPLPDRRFGVYAHNMRRKQRGWRYVGSFDTIDEVCEYLVDMEWLEDDVAEVMVLRAVRGTSELVPVARHFRKPRARETRR